MTSTPVEQVLLDELTPIVAKVEALTPEEARQARDRLLDREYLPRTEDARLTVEELATADLDRMLCERAEAPDLDTEASGKLERIRHNFSRLDSKPPAEQAPDDDLPC